jgi:LytS/YehU family sensor histidine kinase
VRVSQTDRTYNYASGPLQLKYFQNSVEVNFTAPFYGNQSLLQYRYKLTGADTGWKYNGSNNSIRFTSLNPGKYIFQVAASVNGVDWYDSDNKITLYITPPFWKKGWFLALMAATLIMLLIFLFLRRMKQLKKQQALKTEKLKTDAIKELQLSNLRHDLAASKLTALRSQMNPHFIFNALNSIQQYILQGNITEANRYLSKFSKLQRQVLNQSDQNFIPLDKELEVLNLYLELEQLRFENGFTYKIEVNKNVDTDEIKIPPMIVQPFVENAIWHGLMPKQDNRNLVICFEMSGDEILVCTVADNGIGREAAARLKNGNQSEHKSRGLSLVYDRLNILSQQYGKAFKAEVKDLMDSEGLPAGTEVKLFIYTG